MRDIEFYYNIFGSKSSKDYDIMVFINELSDNIEDNKKLCKFFDNILSNLYKDKELNCNIGVLDNDNRLIEVFKGSVDECNNSIYKTYSYHYENQKCPLMIHHMVERDIELKLIRICRILCTILSRHPLYRTQIKSALKGTVKDQIEALRLINFYEPIDIGSKNLLLIDVYKTIAFQIGQGLGLINGVELYTKEDIADYYHGLQPYLYRHKQASEINIGYYISNFFIEIIRSYKHILNMNENNYTSKYKIH